MNFHSSTYPQHRNSYRRPARSFAAIWPVNPAAIKAKVAAAYPPTTQWPYEPSVAEIAAAVRTHPRCVHAALGRDRKTLNDAEIDHLISTASVPIA